jgi:predicted carbohydrate-binding protein with CBM5 and CBM33 domain
VTLRRLAIVPAALALLVLAAIIGITWHSQPASAHGAMQIPGSRTYLCYEDGLTSTGEIIPQNPACAAAVAQSGTTPLYNWFAVLRSDGAGRTAGFIPDGQLCSGGTGGPYDFTGFNLARTDWPRTHLTSGADIQIHYNKWAAHPGTFSLYISKPGVDLSQPLTWADFDMATPFSQATDPPSVGDPGSIDSYYYWDATLPANRTGDAIIYSVWARSDSTETFYGCSDVTFDGGNGEVTGLGNGGGTSTSPTPSASPTASPTMTDDPGGCMASYALSSTWNGGFQAEVSVMNHGASALDGWSVHWALPDGEAVTSVWNGTLSQSGSNVTVSNVDWNGNVAPDGMTTFGFTGTGPAAVPAVTCTSP